VGKNYLKCGEELLKCGEELFEMWRKIIENMGMFCIFTIVIITNNVEKYLFIFHNLFCKYGD
jgi:hypothetical protein